MAASIVLLAFYIQLALGHFSISYPYWRGDSFKTQWTRPCGGVNVTTNRTQWPLDGGSLVYKGSHPWAITYVNLGLGSDEAVVFNISLVKGFNQTGNGTFCFPKINIPNGVSVAAGANASLQVIQLSELGSSLYNCADITFSSDAKVLASNECTNSSGISWKPLADAPAATTSMSSTGSSASAKPSGGAANSVFTADHIPFKLQIVATVAGLFGPWLI